MVGCWQGKLYIHVHNINHNLCTYCTLGSTNINNISTRAVMGDSQITKSYLFPGKIIAFCLKSMRLSTGMYLLRQKTYNVHLSEVL
jgi:hypothetical protein